MKLGKILFGVATFIPGLDPFRWKSTGGTDDAKYCYSVWMRHLVIAGENGLNTHPETVAEIGPGDSLGIGLMALLTGSSKYFALDLVRFADVEKNRELLHELVEMLRSRVAIPGPDVFPGVKPSLDSYDFPDGILPQERLDRALLPERIAEIDAALAIEGSDQAIINYKVPWMAQCSIDAHSFDMIYSQAVLEHIDDLSQVYSLMSEWLKPDGFISHQIDFKCHGITDEWNGHWFVQNWLWRILKGRRPYLLNREPWSVHKNLAINAGFRIEAEQVFRMESKFNRDQLNSQFLRVTDEDLTIAGVHLLGVVGDG